MNNRLIEEMNKEQVKNINDKQLKKMIELGLEDEKAITAKNVSIRKDLEHECLVAATRMLPRATKKEIVELQKVLLEQRFKEIEKEDRKRILEWKAEKELEEWAEERKIEIKPRRKIDMYLNEIEETKNLEEKVKTKKEIKPKRKIDMYLNEFGEQEKTVTKQDSYAEQMKRWEKVQREKAREEYKKRQKKLGDFNSQWEELQRKEEEEKRKRKIEKNRQKHSKDYKNENDKETIKTPKEQKITDIIKTSNNFKKEKVTGFAPFEIVKKIKKVFVKKVKKAKEEIVIKHVIIDYRKTNGNKKYNLNRDFYEMNMGRPVESSNSFIQGLRGTKINHEQAIRNSENNTQRSREIEPVL